MPTTVRRKRNPKRATPRKLLPRRRARAPKLVLSDAEIARINGAEESMTAVP